MGQAMIHASQAEMPGAVPRPRFLLAAPASVSASPSIPNRKSLFTCLHCEGAPLSSPDTMGNAQRKLKCVRVIGARAFNDVSPHVGVVLGVREQRFQRRLSFGSHE